MCSITRPVHFFWRMCFSSCRSTPSSFACGVSATPGGVSTAKSAQVTRAAGSSTDAVEAPAWNNSIRSMPGGEERLRPAVQETEVAPVALLGVVDGLDPAQFRLEAGLPMGDHDLGELGRQGPILRRCRAPPCSPRRGMGTSWSPADGGPRAGRSPTPSSGSAGSPGRRPSEQILAGVLARGGIAGHVDLDPQRLQAAGGHVDAWPVPKRIRQRAGGLGHQFVGRHAFRVRASRRYSGPIEAARPQQAVESPRYMAENSSRARPSPSCPAGTRPARWRPRLGPHPIVPAPSDPLAATFAAPSSHSRRPRGEPPGPTRVKPIRKDHECQRPDQFLMFVSLLLQGSITTHTQSAGDITINRRQSQAKHVAAGDESLALGRPALTGVPPLDYVTAVGQTGYVRDSRQDRFRGQDAGLQEGPLVDAVVKPQGCIAIRADAVYFNVGVASRIAVVRQEDVAQRDPVLTALRRVIWCRPTGLSTAKSL